MCSGVVVSVVCSSVRVMVPPPVCCVGCCCCVLRNCCVVFGRVGPSLWSSTQVGLLLAESDGSVALTVEGDWVSGVHSRRGGEDLGEDVHDRRALLLREV